MQTVVIVSAVRTPIGRFGGALRDVGADALAAHVAAGAVRAAGIEPSEIESVVFGQMYQTMAAPNVARIAAIGAGCRMETPAYTVQRNCGSGLNAITCAAQAIAAGEVEICLAGGVESMSTIPYYLKGSRWGYRLRHTELTDMLWEGLTDYHEKQMMGYLMDTLGMKYGITRIEQDEFAAESHRKALTAIKDGKFKDEISPMEVISGKEKIIFDTDESPRDDVTVDSLSRLKPAFRPDGNVTAGNACPLNDGAAALVLMSGKAAQAHGIKPLAHIRSYAYAAVPPAEVGIAPVYSCPTALERAGIALKDIDLIEITETMSAQVLSVEKELKWDRERVNVNGGTIALGHPTGATGCRLVVTLVHEMRRRAAALGLATMCIAGGQGGSIIVEAV
ncbi:MAG: thiolase family protein [bacterium]